MTGGSASAFPVGSLPNAYHDWPVRVSRALLMSRASVDCACFVPSRKSTRSTSACWMTFATYWPTTPRLGSPNASPAPERGGGRLDCLRRVLADPRELRVAERLDVPREDGESGHHRKPSPE